jgi:hypothetical protein
MVRSAARLLALLLLLLGGCRTTVDREAENRQGFNWRLRATEVDRERLRGWRNTWVEGLREAREAGHGAEIEREGVLLDPDAALAEPRIPAGRYACRTLKLGRRGPTGLAFVSYPAFQCEVIVADGVVRLVKHTGSQRPTGILYDESPRRMVFIGTLVLGDEERPLDYGFDRERNMIGALERVGERRWRLVLPRPSFESDVDVIELVPAP